MTDPNQSLPIAGWYPDPENDKGDRWWNGSSWSDHRRSRDTVPAGPAAFGGATGAPAISTPPGYQRPNPYGAPVAGAPLVGAPYQAAQPYASQYPSTAPNPATPATYGQPYAQPYAPAYAQPYTPYASPTTGNRNTPALVGFIVSLGGIFIGVAFLSGIAGTIVSIIGLQRSRALAAQGVTVGNGRAFAIAGIIIGVLSLIGSVLLLAWVISASSSPY